MSTEKKQLNFLKTLQKTFNLQIPIFLEGKEVQELAFKEGLKNLKNHSFSD